MYFYLLLLTFIEFLWKFPLSFIGHFFWIWTKQILASNYIAPKSRFLANKNSINEKNSHLIFHTIFPFGRNFFLMKCTLILYCWLFYDLTTMFFANLQFVYWRTPPSSIGHFFEIWPPLFLTINKLFTLKHLNWKMTTKKGHDDTTEKSVYVMPYLDGQCSHPCGWI